MHETTAINPKDRFLVVQDGTGRALESHPTREAADHFCKVGNDHNTKNGHPARYHVKEV